MPLELGRFSTTTGCFHTAVSFSPTSRAVTSAAPPAVNGTTMRIGCRGKSAAAPCAADTHARAPQSATAHVAGSAPLLVTRHSSLGLQSGLISSLRHLMAPPPVLVSPLNPPYCSVIGPAGFLPSRT